MAINWTLELSCEMIKAFQSQWQGEKLDLLVMDGAFFEEENLIDSKERFNWISRVPLTIKVAQELTKTLLSEQFTQSSLYKDYRFCTVCSEYARVKQQWVIVESEQYQRSSLFCDSGFSHNYETNHGIGNDYDSNSHFKTFVL